METTTLSAADPPVAGLQATQPTTIGADAGLRVSVLSEEAIASLIDEKQSDPAGKVSTAVRGVVGRFMDKLRTIKDNHPRNPLITAPLSAFLFATDNAVRFTGFMYALGDVGQWVAGKFAPKQNDEEPNNLKQYAAYFGLANSAFYMGSRIQEDRSMNEVLGELEQVLAEKGLPALEAQAKEKYAALPMREKAVRWLSDNARALGSAMILGNAGLLYAYGQKEGKVGERAGALANFVGFGSLLLEEAETIPERAWYNPLQVVDQVRYRQSLLTTTTALGASVGNMLGGKEDLDKAADENLSAADRRGYKIAAAGQIAGQTASILGDVGIAFSKKDFEGNNNNPYLYRKAAELMVAHAHEAEGVSVEDKLRNAAHQVAEYLALDLSLHRPKIENKLLSMVSLEQGGQAQSMSAVPAV